MDPLAVLRARLVRGEAVVCGVLSGTSADGIDVVLARFPPCARAAPDAPLELGPPRALAFETAPFPPELAARVRRLLDGGTIDLAGVACLGRDLGRAFGRAARDLAREHRLALELVGSHGQTVFHHDGRAALGPATLQLGDPAFLAEEAGAVVVHDFRAADLAAGGEGAPLSALCDELLYGALERPALVLNLGGMANLTFLPDPRTEAPLVAFDTGPAGSLLDGLARRLLDRPFDEDGACAARGEPDPRLLAELLSHPFLERAPPKSTGRDTFGEPWVDALLGRARALGLLERGPERLMATAVAFVASSVGGASARFLPGPPRAWVACGGGARNRTLVRALAHALGREPVPSERFGVDPDAREALVFATLAARCVLGLPSTRAGATGARAGHVLGSITPYRPAPRERAGISEAATGPVDVG